MKTVVFTALLTLVGVFTPLAQAQVIPLVIDPAQSSVDISVAGSLRGSQLSGDLTLAIQSTDPPAGTAQITDMDIVLDEGLDFTFGFGFLSASASTAPGEVTLSLVTPGAPGTISGGSFAQLANLFTFGGDLMVNDPFGLAGGSRTADLSTIQLSPFDFDSIDVTQSGNVITVSGRFAGSQTTSFGEITVDSTFVATGVVPVSVVKGDIDMNGGADFGDIPAFIAVLQAGTFQAEADCNCNGEVNFADIPDFIAILQMQ